MARPDRQRPELVKGEAPVREGAGRVLDPVQLGLLVRIVLVRQHDLQMIVHVPDAGHALSGGGGLQVLRIARDGAVDGDVPVDVHDMNVRVVDERVELELGLDRLTEPLPIGHIG